MNSRIIPLNLPAQLASEVEGNPSISRLESAVANCYPGLEVDLRNLDRRFFPGLVFSFVTTNGNDNNAPKGAQLVAVDFSDPAFTDLPPETKEQISSASNELNTGKLIFLDSIKAGRVRLNLQDKEGVDFDWNIVWRLVRGLKAEKVEIELGTRPKMDESFSIKLAGFRREYQAKDGKLPDAHQAGELTQSLCSPWQHDFRDCGCSYWASNRPDIVLPSYPATIDESLLPGKAGDRAEDPILWLRWDRSQEAAPYQTNASNKPFNLDYYEINERWKELAIVLEDRESQEIYSPAHTEEPKPMDEDLKEKLVGLARIEQALALEYLYARSSVRTQDKALTPTEQEHADFMAHELFVIAISEMKHLSWVNQLLMELYRCGKIDSFEPELGVADRIPPTGRRTESRTINEAINDFIDAESSSGTVDGQYAKLVDFFLDNKYPEDLTGLLRKIIDDGVYHYERFREIKSLIERYPGRLVRPLAKLDLGDKRYREGHALYRSLIEKLRTSFATDSPAKEAREKAKKEMRDLFNQMDKLAGIGIGLPLIELSSHTPAQSVLKKTTSKKRTPARQG